MGTISKTFSSCHTNIPRTLLLYICRKEYKTFYGCTHFSHIHIHTLAIGKCSREKYSKYSRYEDMKKKRKSLGLVIRDGFMGRAHFFFVLLFFVVLLYLFYFFVFVSGCRNCHFMRHLSSFAVDCHRSVRTFSKRRGKFECAAKRQLDFHTKTMTNIQCFFILNNKSSANNYNLNNELNFVFILRNARLLTSCIKLP